MSIGNFPESLSQAILVETLGVSGTAPQSTFRSRFGSRRTRISGTTTTTTNDNNNNDITQNDYNNNAQ